MPGRDRGGAGRSLAILGLGAFLLGGWSCDRGRPGAAPARAKAPVVPPAAPALSAAGASSPAPSGLPAPPGDEAAVAAASRFLAPPVRLESCGPYRMRSDLAGPRLVTLIDLCRILAESLDGEYARRVGVPLSGPAAGTIVVFASRRRFRDYVAADAGLPRGYAGFSVPWAGLVALPVGDIADAEVARTLSHELAHLAHRRAFGRDLPPWLAEGLADAISDSATPQGYRPLGDLTVVEGMRSRLRGGAQIGRVAAIESLVALDRERFDRAQPSYDYEQSALLVRFLLLDRELAPLFRRWLREWAARGPRAAPALDVGLGRSWAEIEARFGAWLEGP